MRLIDADELRRRIIAFSTGSNTTYLTVENIVTMINKADDFCSFGQRKNQSADVRNMGQFAGGGKTDGGGGDES